MTLFEEKEDSIRTGKKFSGSGRRKAEIATNGVGISLKNQGTFENKIFFSL